MTLEREMFTGKAHANLHRGDFIGASEHGAESVRGPACGLIETENSRKEIQGDSLKAVTAVEPIKARGRGRSHHRER